METVLVALVGRCADVMPLHAQLKQAMEVLVVGTDYNVSSTYSHTAVWFDPYDRYYELFDSISCIYEQFRGMLTQSQRLGQIAAKRSPSLGARLRATLAKTPNTSAVSPRCRETHAANKDFG